MKYCFEDIVTISIISDPVNRINNKLALEEFLRKSSLGQETYIKILELTYWKYFFGIEKYDEKIKNSAKLNFILQY